MYTSNTIKNHLENIVRHNVEPANILGIVARRVGFIRSNFLLHLFAKSIDDMNRYESEVAVWQGEVNTDIDSLEKLLEDQVTLDKLAEFRTAWVTHLKIWREQVVPLSRANRDEEAFALARKMGAAGTAVRKAMYILDELHEAIIAAANHGMKLSEQTSRKSQYISLAFVFLAVTLGLAFGIRRSSSIAGPVNAVSKAAQRVAAGDLGQTVTVKTGDEIELLADSFNTMTGKLKRMVEELRHEITERKQAEEELRQYREHLEGLVEERTAKLKKANIHLQHEIEERKQTEMAIRESETRYSTLADASFEGIMIHEKGIIYDVNNRFAEMFGYDIAELIGSDAYELIAPDLRDALRNRVASEDERPYEILGLRKDLSTFPMEIRARHMLYHGRKMRVVVARDITDRKLTEEDLRKSEEKYRQLVESTSDWVWACDVEGRQTFANEAVKTILGYEIHKISGMLASSLMHPEDRERVRKWFKGSVEEKKGWKSSVLRWQHKDGTVRFLESSAKPVLDSQGNLVGFTGIDRDVTERKRTEEERAKFYSAIESLNLELEERVKDRTRALEVAVLEAKKSLKEKELLLREIHHRVKNNLQIISSLLKLQAYIANDERVTDALKESQSRVYAMASIHEILYGSGGLASIDIRSYISNLAKTIFQAYGASRERIDLEVEIEDIKLGIDQAVPLGLLINELVSNSLKYAFPGNRAGQIIIKIQALDQGELECIVGDNGAGIQEKLDWRSTDTLGFKLVKILGENQLDGITNLDLVNGTHFSVRFKIKESH